MNLCSIFGSVEGCFVSSCHDFSNGVITVWIHRQRLELKSVQAGPGLIAGKQVAGVIKTLDSSYVALPLVAEPVKSECKKCPSVSKHRLVGCQVGKLSRMSVKDVSVQAAHQYQYQVRCGVGSMGMM